MNPHDRTHQKIELTTDQKDLIMPLAQNLANVEKDPENIHFALIKQRYFKIIKTDPVIENLMELQMPLLPKPVLTFSVNRVYPPQFDQLNQKQIMIIQTFINHWQRLNHIESGD